MTAPLTVRQVDPERPPLELQRLRDELRADVGEDVDMAMRVAVLLQLDMPQAVMAERLGVSLTEVKAAISRLRKIANRIGWEREAEHE